MYKNQGFLVILKRNIEFMKIVIQASELEEIKSEEIHSKHSPRIEIGTVPIFKNIIRTQE